MRKEIPNGVCHEDIAIREIHIMEAKRHAEIRDTLSPIYYYAARDLLLTPWQLATYADEDGFATRLCWGTNGLPDLSYNRDDLDRETDTAPHYSF